MDQTKILTLTREDLLKFRKDDEILDISLRSFKHILRPFDVYNIIIFKDQGHKIVLKSRYF